MGRGNWLPHTSDAEYVFVDDVYEGHPESHDQWWYQARYSDFKEEVTSALPEGYELVDHSGRNAQWDAKDINAIVRLATYKDDEGNETVAVGTYDDDVYVVVSVYPIVPEHISMYEPDEAEKMREKAVAKVKEISNALFDQLDEWYPLRRRNGAWMSSQYVRSDGSESKYKKSEVETMTSTVYIQVKAVVEHDVSVSAEDVLSECNYKFESNAGYSSIKETELQAYADKPWE